MIDRESRDIDAAAHLAAGDALPDEPERPDPEDPVRPVVVHPQVQEGRRRTLPRRPRFHTARMSLEPDYLGDENRPETVIPVYLLHDTRVGKAGITRREVLLSLQDLEWLYRVLPDAIASFSHPEAPHER